MVAIPPTSLVQWMPSWRLVPSRFPPVSLFDRVSDPDDLDAIIAIEGLTNARIREEMGQLECVPKSERQSGPGTTPIMASFTHINPDGSRFSDGNFGVYYAAKEIETALAETRYHRQRFLARTNEGPLQIDMRSYASDIDCEFHDVRALQSDIYDPNSYGASQALATRLLKNDSNGIVYDSVRHDGGECLAVFRANIPKPVVQGSHYCFCWNGTAIVDTYIKTRLPREQ